MAVFLVLYALYVWATWDDYKALDRDRANLVRLVTTTGWIGLAALILLIRKRPPRLDSFVGAALIIAPLVVFAWFGFEGAGWWPVFVGTTLTYAAVNGFVAVTVQGRLRAGLVGLVVLGLQMVTDILGHALAGTLKIH
jgi:hypothetical protein